MSELKWEKKCWGKVLHVFKSSNAAVSHLKINRGFRCSKHKHKFRANLFAVVTGVVLIEEWVVDDEDWDGSEHRETSLQSGQVYVVPSGVWHRFRVIESGTMVEVYWPVRDGFVSMDDIVRMDEGGPDV